MHNYLKILITTALCIAFAFRPQPVAAHEGHTHTLPDGFTTSVVTPGFSYPTGFTQAPDGRFFVLEKSGQVKVVQNGTTASSPMLSLSVNTEGERGLLGIALDPSFANNGYMYLYYTNNSPLETRISRFTVTGNTAGSEVILMRSTQPLDVIHHAGTLRFGPDGKLWASIGNNGNNANSQDLSNIHGKIIRINKDGSIPSDNPFVGQAGKNASIWAYGFRNPFRFNFLGGKPIVGDVGQDLYEEINIVEKGGNYGWPQAEGFCGSCGFINPLYAYSHSGQSSSVTGGFFLPTNGNNFPTQYTNAYYYGDYARGFIHYLSFDNNGNFVADNPLSEEAGTVVDLLKGADGALYYITIADQTFGPGTGKLEKIAFDTSNQPPFVVIDATPKGGPAPLSVQFSSTGTTDPEGSTLSYSWEFGDGTANSTNPNPTHVYTQNGTYTATLSVSDGEKTAMQSIQIQVGNTPPTATIITPVEGAKYNAGQTVSYSATTIDEEDGTLSASAVAWDVIFHHDTHVHPFQTFIATKSGTFVIPDSGEPSPTTWYEIRLTVTDSKGLSHTSSRVITPNVSTMIFTSTPATGLTIKIDGVPVQTPYTVTGVVGFKRTIDVQTPQNANGNGYDYLSWSDNGAKLHEITTPLQNTTYTANFTQFTAGTGHIRFRVREKDENGNWTGKFLNGVKAKVTDITETDVLATAISAPDPINGEDGWVWFQNVDAGTYGVITYGSGYKGVWKQTDCNGTGTTQNATIKNSHTEGLTGVFHSAVQVTPSQIAYCKDAGLQQLAAQGNITFKVWEIDLSTQSVTGFGPAAGMNDVTVKLTDASGAAVLKTATTKSNSSGDTGWVSFSDIPVGTYGILAYKTGFEGFWRQTDCNLSREVNVGLQNSNTEGLKASWNPNVPVVTGETTFCRDLGLRKIPGDIKLRIREFNDQGGWTGNFLNGVTAKLTDPTGSTVYDTTTSQVRSGQDGWVVFDSTHVGNYAVIAYKQGLTGLWKQTTCEGSGVTTGATVQNANTEGNTAGWQNSLTVQSNTITWCADIGLKPVVKGTIAFRVREFENGTPYSGKFINGATAKLTTPDGLTVLQTTNSALQNGEDGWVRFANVTAGSYGIITYKSGLTGLWKQTTCEGAGSTDNASIQNGNTEGNTAGWQTPVAAVDSQTTWCRDVALEKTDAVQHGTILFRVREYDNNGVWTGAFVNGATAKLTDQTITVAHKTVSSSSQNGQDGWVHFDTVPTGTYTIVVYKQGVSGFWRQTTCEGAGSTDNASVQNSLTENVSAAKQEGVSVSANQITWCKNVGLKMSGPPTVQTQTETASGSAK